MTSSAASDTDSARNRVSGSVGADRLEHGQPAAVGHVHVEQHDVGTLSRVMTAIASADAAGLADHVDPLAELGAHAGAEHRMVVDQHDPCAVIAGGILISTSVPPPGVLRHLAPVPPCRSIRPMIEPRTPCRSSATASRSKPTPRSLTKTLTCVGLDLGVERHASSRRSAWPR